MHFYRRGNLVVIFGGRKFVDVRLQDRKQTEFVDDIRVLRVDTLEWFKVSYKSEGFDRFPDLYNFSSALVDDKIVVFGGMKGKYTLSRDMFSIELEDVRTAYEAPVRTEVKLERNLSLGGL